jgi:tellurite resistance protein
MTDPQAALISTMVIASAADGHMSDRELQTIGDIVRHLPVFRRFQPERIGEISDDCQRYLEDEDGLDRAMAMIREALPAALRETAYALACDVAVADGRLAQEELRFLEMLRHELDIDRLHAAAIERAAAVRHRTV